MSDAAGHRHTAAEALLVRVLPALASDDPALPEDARTNAAVEAIVRSTVDRIRETPEALGVIRLRPTTQEGGSSWSGPAPNR